MSDFDPEDEDPIHRHALIGVFGFRIAVPQVGENSFSEFVNGKSWSVIARFPQNPSDRSRLAGACFEQCLLYNLDPTAIVVDANKVTDNSLILSDYVSIEAGLNSLNITSERFAFLGFHEFDTACEERIVEDYDPKADNVSHMFQNGDPLILELYIHGEKVGDITDAELFQKGDVVENFTKWLQKYNIIITPQRIFSPKVSETPPELIT